MLPAGDFFLHKNASNPCVYWKIHYIVPRVVLSPDNRPKNVPNSIVWTATGYDTTTQGRQNHVILLAFVSVVFFELIEINCFPVRGRWVLVGDSVVKLVWRGSVSDCLSMHGSGYRSA